MLTEIGKQHKTEEIYQTLRHAFRYMNNKIYAVICLADYGDDRAVAMFKNYINRNQKTIERDLFYEMMSAIQHLGGDFVKDQILFGHQNAGHIGVSIDAADGTESDVKNLTGRHPAVVGIDTLGFLG